MCTHARCHSASKACNVASTSFVLGFINADVDGDSMIGGCRYF